MSEGISIKLPLMYSSEDGPYQLTKTLPENIKQNFKHMVLTTPGEKIMDPDFGVGAYGLLFEQGDMETMDNLKERVFTQTNTYMPFIQLTKVDTTFKENTLTLQVEYLIPSLGESDTFSLDIKNQLF
jgi:phage baseplate assembly protein W